LLAAFLGVASAGAIAIYQSGIGTVRVKTPDVSLFIPVPMGLIRVGLALTPAQHLDKIRRELRPHREILTIAIGELVRAPDAVFVEVVDGSELVLIEKRGGNLYVTVHSDDEDVELKIPLHSVEEAVRALIGE
ncbi:MAG TPA: hypothetical protein VMN76_11590, partial [Acidobacteriota bacterium]|nr:hypothetical protein [Acidobacteriota bacterium]